MSDKLRTLLPAKIAASTANISPLEAAIAEVPTALAGTKVLSFPISCKRTGILVGQMNLKSIAGHVPMIGQWRDTMVLHPNFSLEGVALLKFARNTWFRYCNFTVDEAADEKLSAAQEEQLRVCALAMLYGLASDIRQDIAWMPSFVDVSSHWASLMAISYWKYYLDSKRLKFPAIHISKLEKDFELKSYLQTCWNIKKNYETTVTEAVELERVKAAELATIALRDELAGARPTSVRQLWRWFLAHLPKRYEKDAATWMPEIFFAKGEEIREFTKADIDLLEEIFLCEVPVGSAISHAFSEILASKRKYLEQHFEAFEIIIPAEIIVAKAVGAIPAAEPQQKDFASKGAYLVAAAKWRLAHTDLTSKMAAAKAAQLKVTVDPSHVPTLVIREDEIEDDVSDVVDQLAGAVDKESDDENDD